MAPSNRRSGALPFFAAVGVAVAMTWGGLAQQPHLRTVDDKALENASKAPEEWLTYGFDYGETRYSTLSQIDAANVSRLGPAWVAEIGSGGGGQEATPLVSNGVLYAITNWSIVHAIDARTGKERWSFDPKVDRSMDRELTDRICCGVVQRGIALYNGKVYIPAIDGRLIAVDAERGTQVWETQTLPPNLPYSVTMAPRIVKGKVIIGSSGAEFAVRGFVSAYDAETGKLAWRFYTVPGDPSKPFEHPDLEAAAKTWTGEWWKMGGGGTVWDAIAFDPDADLLYIGTGNGGPWNRDYRSPGGGDNLYLSSILALKPDTGKYVWHYQTTPGDNWDYTAVQHLLLADIRLDGRNRKVIMQAPKNGFFYVLDRITGEFISAQPYANVSWAQGIDQKTGRPITNPEAWYGPEGTTLSPGPGGAHNWAPMSYNPATGLVYLPASNSSYLYQSSRTSSSREGKESSRVSGDPRPLSPAAAFQVRRRRRNHRLSGPRPGVRFAGEATFLRGTPSRKRNVGAHWAEARSAAAQSPPRAISCFKSFRMEGSSPTAPTRARNSWRFQQVREAWVRRSRISSMAGSTCPSSPARARCRPTHLVLASLGPLARLGAPGPSSRRVALPLRAELLSPQEVDP